MAESGNRGNRPAPGSANDWLGGTEDLGRGQAVAECLEILEGPDDLLVAGDLEQLGVLRPGVGVADDQVAVGQELQSRDPSEPDARQLVVPQAPDDLALGVDLNDAVAVAGGDQGVAVGLADRAEDLDPVPFGTVARRAGSAREVELVAPDDLALGIVLAALNLPETARPTEPTLPTA